MAIDIKFDLIGNPEPPTIILANRNGNKLGQLNIDSNSIGLVDKFNDACEFSFTFNKYINDKLNPLWDKVVNFKLVYCKEWDTWFEITVELDEATETVKTVYCKQLGQAELSQIKIYNVEINTESDIERDDYKISILYDENDPKASILNRILEKAPHYSIVHVDDTIKNIQRTFSFDNTSICDAFAEVAEEIGCLFVYNSNSGEGGKIQRTISVYDLQQNCNDCGHRGEFTDKCPKCGSTNILNGYGEDTLIFVTSDELASDGIQLTTDTDSVKNCFKLEAGDDLMTATVRSCNPNGSDYIWYFSDDIKEDMSKELVEKLESYDEMYKWYHDDCESEMNQHLLIGYNILVDKYSPYNEDLEHIPSTVKGYASLMNAYYNTIDMSLYLKSGLMPSIEMSETNAKEQASLLTSSYLSPVAVNTSNISSVSQATADSAVLSMAKIIVKPTYKVEIKSSDLSKDKVWTGNFILTSYSDDEDTAESDTIEVVISNDTEAFIKQKIDKSLNKDATEDYSISGLFEKDYDDFCAELKKYALNPLKSFYDSCDTCLGILIEQGAGNQDENPDLYEKLYKPYYDKSTAITAEIKVREEEIARVEGVWNDADEGNKELIAKGLQQHIEERRNEIQDALNFENYLGEELWLEFCAYRREDTYSNDNYISDGLDNAELFQKALEFIEVAENEIYKSSELQHSISTSLNNLLAIPKFKPLVKSFKVGNWIRVKVDDEIFKLRLLEYEIDYGSFDNISVEFSDVTKIKNGITDIQSVLSQTSSMATSYSSIQRQAKQGNEAQETIDKWLTNGLNTALVQIQNNDSEDITITKNGLLGRSYDEITESYSPEQFKLTHNILAYTTDDWKTVSAALGKHEYTKWQNNQWVKDIDYGLTSKFVTAGYVTGSQIIGGEIVSSNYEPKIKGTYINLLNGDFDFAGGKIVYNSSDNEVKLKGVTIQWTGNDGVNAPEVNVKDVTGIEEYLDQLDNLDSRIQTYNQTTDPSLSWTNEEKTNHIGDLWINPDDGITKSWNGSSWEAVTDSTLAELAQSKAQIFTSTPTPPYYVGDLWVQGSTGDIKHCVKTRENGSYDASEWEKSSKYTDDTKANEAHTLANSAKSVADNAKIIGDNLVNGLGFQETEITGKYVISPVIAGGTLLIGDKSGTHAQITTEGQLICTGADISGIIYATDGEFTGKVNANEGEIGGWTIEDGYIHTGNIGRDNSAFLAPNGILSDTTHHIGGSTTQHNWMLTVGSTFGVTYDGKLYTNAAKIGGWNIDNNGMYISTFKISSLTSTEDQTILGHSSKKWRILAGNSSEYNFGVTEDGMLCAKNAVIAGVLSAGRDSSLGEFKVDNNSIFSGGEWDVDNKIAPQVFMCTGSKNPYKIAGKEQDGWAFGAGKNFGVTNNGELYALAGNIGGWNISEHGYLYYGSYGEANSILLSPKGTQYQGSIGGSPNDQAWLLTAGSTFGISDSGKLYASSGKLGGWNIEEDCLSGSTDSTYKCKLFPTGTTLSSGTSSYTFFLVIYDNGGGRPIGGITTSGWKTI